MNKKKTKLWWKDFHKTKPFMAMQEALAQEGYHLKAIFDKDRVCTDVHIYKVELVPDA